MANKRLSMRKIREVLLLCWGKNLSVRQTAESCVVSADDMLIAGQTRRIEEYRGADVIDISTAREKGGRRETAMTESLTSSLLKPATIDRPPGERRTAQVLDLKAKTYYSRAKAVRSTDVFRAADGQEG